MLQAQLDRNTLLAAGALAVEEWVGVGDKRQQQNVLVFKGIKLQDYRTGVITLFLGDILAEIHPALEPFVTEVSHYENFGNNLSPRRRLGHYRLGSASAEMEVVGSSRDAHYHLKTRAKKLSDLRELYRLIRQGQIWPAVDYEGPQVPPPFRHLRDLLGEAWQLLRRDVRDRLSRIRERIVK